MSRGSSCAINWRLPRCGRLRRHVLLACAVFLVSSHYAQAQAAFEDVSSQVSITRSGLVLNRVTNTFDCLVQVTNTSAATLSGPLVLGVSSISTTNVTLFNPAGQDASGNPYINLAVPTGGLAPGQTIANSLLKFKNPSRVVFTFSISVLSQAPSTNEGTTIQDATGGTITVAGPDNPNATVTIVIPPGVLGVASDIISVSFSSTPPGPLRPAAVAAGAHFVSSVITLTRASGLKFLRPIQVTIPYILSQVGPGDSVLVAYWDIGTNSYDGVATIGIDRIKGTISFQTVHFSKYSVAGLPISLDPTRVSSVPAEYLMTDTLFRSDTDGFPIANFTSMVGDASGGACFGLTAFAKWYYETQSSKGQASPLATSSTFNEGMVAEDDVDRELIYWSFSDTIQANRDSTFLNLQAKSDYETANSLFVHLLVFDRPELIVLAADGSYRAPTGLHSVVVFNYSIDPTNLLVHFGFYDPNDPGEDQVLHYQINQSSFFLPAYTDVFGTHYSWAYFNSLSSVAAPSDFGPALTNASNGWPNRHFKEIVIDDTNSTGLTLSSPEGPNPVTNPAAYQVFTGSPMLAMQWTCSCPPTDKINTNTVYAHFFVNGEFKENIPIQSLPPGTPTPFSFQITSDVLASSAEPELIVIISDFPFFEGDPNVPVGFDPVDYALSYGYEGFLRIKLKPPLYQVTTMIYGAQAFAAEETYGQPTQYNVAQDDRICYPPAVLAPQYPYINASLFQPYSPILPIACVGYNQVNSYPLQVISPIFSDTLSAGLSTGSGIANFNLHFSPNSISVDGSAAAQSSGRASVGITIVLLVLSPVNFQATSNASPGIDRVCTTVAGVGLPSPYLGIAAGGAGTLLPPSASLGGTLSSFSMVSISLSVSGPAPLGGAVPAGCTGQGPSAPSSQGQASASISFTP
jgi:hypothetical protein